MVHFNRDINIWITSDTHYQHRNICRGTTDWLSSSGLPSEQTRNFETLEDMNQNIVDNINSNVMRDDILIHLGDWSFTGVEKAFEFRDRLNCNKIYLILGNHDQYIDRNKNNSKSLFNFVGRYEEMTYMDHSFCLMHYPISSWNGLDKGSLHLHGHRHLSGDNRFGKGRRMDIGIDGHPEFRPYNIGKEIIPLLNKKEKLHS